MDFNDSAEEAEFRARAIAFLESVAKRRAADEPPIRSQMTPESVASAKAYQAKKAEAGFAGIAWPKEWGGQGGTQIQNIIFTQEEHKFDVEPTMFQIGLGMCVPTVCTWGTQEHRERFAPKALRGEEIWCQLFSEPAGGSDLAALRTKAVKDGDDWVINGQKIWTTGAHVSDWAVLVTRTDFEAPKHKGLTYFFLDMKSPGVEVRPIKQMNEHSSFNEVFFTDVRIPDSQRLGAVGQGWEVSLTTLMNERYTIGETPRPDVAELIRLAEGLEGIDGPLLEDPGFEEKIADWYVRDQGVQNTRMRTMTALSQGKTPGPESSINKLVLAPKHQDICGYAMDVLGVGGAGMGDDAAMGGLFHRALLSSPAGRVAGGTDEVMKNILAERVLGLPGDARADKGLPFNKIPSGPKG